jgi:hypothetical protein
MMQMTKKVVRGAKKNEKNRPSAEPYKTTKMEPDTGGEKPRSGRVTRSVYDAIAWGWPCRWPPNNQQHGNSTSSASVAMCETFFDTCAAYLHEWLIPQVGLMKAGACERSEMRAGITKVREDFFDTKFHDGTQASESTHAVVTIAQHHECV